MVEWLALYISVYSVVYGDLILAILLGTSTPHDILSMRISLCMFVLSIGLSVDPTAQFVRAIRLRCELLLPAIIVFFPCHE